ncbi:flagellar hook-basal body protein [Desulfolucanica intricata]|uniref:flagellar hook-basal body protein n=1 Tax=Desulfolucanica intricata TaxID=1285191 RepID=UPI000836680F|nr:flagellar hook-basal body complex protein [Desulfolucanica intricata]
MLKTLMNGVSGLNAYQIYMDNAANNIANVNTACYKSEKVKFSDLLFQSTDPSTKEAEDKTKQQFFRNGVQVSDIRKVFSNGILKDTGNLLDLAVEGPGFLQVISPAGEEFYTRGGTLRIDENNYLVDSFGNRVYPGFEFPADYRDVVIAPNGKVTVSNSEGEAEELGQIVLYNFINPSGLITVDSNLYVPGEESGAAEEGFPGEAGYGVLNQGYLEASNVDLINEMTRLIEARRAYQINVRAISTADEMWGIANNLRGR